MAGCSALSQDHGPAVKAMLYSVHDQSDAPAVHGQFDRLIDYVDDKLPEAGEHVTAARETSSRSPASPKGSGSRSWSNNPNERLQGT